MVKLSKIDRVSNKVRLIHLEKQAKQFSFFLSLLIAARRAL